MTAIAIDGPAGAGKSTISRKVAEALGFIYVDTGALYRTVGLGLLRAGITCDDEQEVKDFLPSVSVDIVFKDGEQRVLLGREDISDLIRTPECSMMASKCSALPSVRAFLLDCQRELARKNNVVMDGRDIGTVVLPDAKVKIFLTASPEVRARRRYAELVGKGADVKYEDVLSDLIKRDYNDSHRSIAPLKPADDAVIIDTTDLNLEQSIELMINTARKHI